MPTPVMLLRDMFRQVLLEKIDENDTLSTYMDSPDCLSVTYSGHRLIWACSDLSFSDYKPDYGLAWGINQALPGKRGFGSILNATKAKSD
jgi:hypothetical protein